MKKFTKLPFTKENEQLVINLCKFLYPEYNDFICNHDNIHVYFTNDHAYFTNDATPPTIIIHWYELMKNHILPDLEERLNIIIKKFDEISEDSTIMNKEKTLTSIEDTSYDIEGVIYESTFVEETQEVFKEIERIFNDIKKYEKIIIESTTS